MKRSIFVATLALTPALLHAQATTPAQALQARATAPAAIKAVAPKDSGSKVRVSTGIVGPRLLNPLVLTALNGPSDHIVAKDLTVVVTLTVNADGKTSNVAISQPVGAGIDQEVIAAISQARFQPGTLDGQPYALPVHLNVLIEHGAKY